MNERIKELAEQAVSRFDKDMDGSMEPTENGRWVYYNDLTEFAELIVEKCAGIIESQDVDPSFKLRMSWAVKQYFGVDE